MFASSCWLALLVPLPPQTEPPPVLWRVDVGPERDVLRDRVALVGDHDGDGLRDVAIGRPMRSRFHAASGPALRVLSSRDGGLVFERELEHAHPDAGWRVEGVGDVDGDGVPDLAAMAEPPYPDVELPEYQPQITWISGTTLEPLGRSPGREQGLRTARNAPVAASTGCSLGELALTASGGSSGSVNVLGMNAGKLEVVRGAGAWPTGGFTQAARVCFPAPVSASRIGIAFDVPDQITTSHVELYELSIDATGGAHCAFVWDSGSLDDEGFYPFSRIAAPGDLDGDGCGDVLAGVDISDWVLGRGIRGRVRALSGVDGRCLYEIRGEAPEGRFGIAISPMGDLDADGRPDFAVGEPGRAPFRGRVSVVSGRHGEALGRLEGAPDQLRFGGQIFCPGDVDGDGLGELIAITSRTKDADADFDAIVCLSLRPLLDSR